MIVIKGYKPLYVVIHLYRNFGIFSGKWAYLFVAFYVYQGMRTEVNKIHAFDHVGIGFHIIVVIITYIILYKQEARFAHPLLHPLQLSSILWKGKSGKHEEVIV